MKKVTREDQLKCKGNFINGDGRLQLVRCVACRGFETRGRENYALNVSFGVCAWCEWDDEEEVQPLDISEKKDD